MTHESRVQGAAWALGVLLAASCASSSREFGGNGGGTSGGDTTLETGDGIQQAGGVQSDGAPGGSGAEAGGAGAGDDDAFDGNAGGFGGMEGGHAAGAGHVAGAGGENEGEPEACPSFSCCISGKVFEANAASPLNPCEVCKPAASTASWTAASGQTCASEQGYAVAPQSAIAKNEACATNCSATQPTLMATMKLSLSFTGSGQSLTSHESFVELDFSNLAPSAGLSVGNATLELHAEPDAPTAETRYVTVRRVDVATQICKLPLPTTSGLVKLTCDVTSAVKSWIASPADAKRAFKISYSGPGDRSISLRTTLASDGTQRPTLRLDYTGKCQGNVCPPLDH